MEWSGVELSSSCTSDVLVLGEGRGDVRGIGRGGCFVRSRFLGMVWDGMRGGAWFAAMEKEGIGVMRGRRDGEDGISCVRAEGLERLGVASLRTFGGG